MLDLSAVTFLEPYAVVYLGMFLRHHRANGCHIWVMPPQHPTTRDYLTRQRFWERFNLRSDQIDQERLHRFTTSTSLNDIVDIENQDGVAEGIASEVLRVLGVNHVKVDARLIAELVGELVDNFARHSERTLAACLIQYYPNARRVAFAIGDCGIGIRSSLSSNPQYEYLAQRPHYEAAMKAFEPLVTRSHEGGMGLTDVQQGVVETGGSLVLTTSDSYYTASSRGASAGTRASGLTGVQVALSFPEVN